MSQRPLGVLTEAPVSRIQDRHVFGFEFPWLPTVAVDGDRDELRDAFSRQVAMVRALAEHEGRSTGVLQLRIVVDEELRGGRTSRVLRVVVLGAAGRREQAERLRERLLATLPPEFTMHALDLDAVENLVDATDSGRWRVGSVAEIRRAIESSDPEADAGSRSPGAPVVLRWEWTRVNLVASLGALHRLPPGTQLVVHLEPRRVGADVLGWLRDEIISLRDTWQDELGTNPLLAAVVGGYRQWLRDLPRACLHLRVLLAVPGGVPDGVAEVVGADLTRSWDRGGPVGTFDVVRPVTAHEHDSALLLLQVLRSDPVREPQPRELGELLHLFDPHEASAAFRLPLPGPEGLPGLRSEPATRLPRGLASAATERGEAVVLGAGPSGEAVTLGLTELNRHVLICGLPGYGKTTTVQSLLRQLWPRDGGYRVPFLVIDPAKADYRGLAEALGDECRFVELGTEHVAFNPFRSPAGVPRRVYATRVAAAFDAAYDLSTTYPAAAAVLTRAVHLVLEEAAPTMARLYATVCDLVERSAYDGRTRSDLRGALVNRLELLADALLGPALMGDAASTVDWVDLLSRPTIVQLRGFAGPRERSLLVALLLAGLVSHREYHPAEEGELAHVTVLEEAHRVLGARVSGASAGDGAAVFVDAMAELRAAGESFVVVEQAPSRLVPEVRKLVGTTIAHRTVDAEERAAVAAALTVPDGAVDLARLRPGIAVVLAADMQSPALVEITAARSERRYPVTPRTSLARTGAAQRLWCQECPVACRGSAGSRTVAELRTRLGADLPVEQILRKAEPTISSSAERWCATAYLWAQDSPDDLTWARRRRRLVQRWRAATRRGSTTSTAGETA